MADGKRDRYEPSDKRPTWAVPPEEIAKGKLSCDECGKPFALDAAKGVAGGLVIFDEGGGKKKLYHGYPELRGKASCYGRAEAKGFPDRPPAS